MNRFYSMASTMKKTWCVVFGGKLAGMIREVSLPQVNLKNWRKALQL